MIAYDNETNVLTSSLLENIESIKSIKLMMLERDKSINIDDRQILEKQIESKYKQFEDFTNLLEVSSIYFSREFTHITISFNDINLTLLKECSRYGDLFFKFMYDKCCILEFTYTGDFFNNYDIKNQNNLEKLFSNNKCGYDVYENLFHDVNNKLENKFNKDDLYEYIMELCEYMYDVLLH